MAITDENTLVMPVQPMGNGYCNNNNCGGFFGNGDSWLGILFLIALLNGGWGGFGGFGGGYGAMMGMGMMDGGFGLYPWLNNSQNINDGFRSQALGTQVGGIQNSITAGFGDVQLGIAGVNQNVCQTGSAITTAVNQGFASTNLGMCQGFNGVTNAVTGAQNAISQQMHNNELASLNRSFAEQTANTQGFNSVQSQLAQCCCDNRSATNDVKYTIATEACNTRAANTANTQAILDKLCQLELDNYKNQVDAKNDQIAQLRQEVLYARGQASQVDQTARILAGQAAEIDGVYNRLKNCPVNTVPVYGNQPIFTCPQSTNNYGCGCGAA